MGKRELKEQIIGKARSRAKKWAWRITATYFWLRVAIGLGYGFETVSRIEHWVGSGAFALASRVGFAPARTDYVDFVVRSGWALIITAFSPIELFGLVLYILFFPIIVIAAGIFVWLAEGLDEKKRQSKGLKEQSTNLPVVSFLSAALIAWFLLYGNSLGREHLVVGTAISWLLFVALAWRAFEKARPSNEADVKLFAAVEKFGPSVSGAMAKSEVKEWKDSDVRIQRKINRLLQWIYIRLSLLVRGKRGRDRIAVAILVEYVWSLLILGLSAVLSWTLLARFFESSTGQTSPYNELLQFSISHFLPGVSPPAKFASLPLWLHYGPAITAWVLFALYIGPAASLFVGRQELHTQRVKRSYEIFRRTALFTFKRERTLDNIAKAIELNKGPVTLDETQPIPKQTQAIR